MKQNFLITFSGLSGVGKTTLINDFLKNFAKDFNLSFSISYTTRQKRKNEINGKNYFFVSTNEFKRMIANDEIIEYVIFRDNFYGTSKIHLLKMLKKCNIIMDIETHGVKNIKRIFKNRVISVYLTCNMDILNNRLLKRYGNNIEYKKRIKKNIAMIKLVNKI